MNVCILSMQRVDNFGSLLQGYALKHLLEDMGRKVWFLDIAPNEEDHKLLDPHTIVSFHEGEESGSFLEKLKKIDQYTLNRIKMKWLSKRQRMHFETFRKNSLETEKPGPDRYDLCVIGSDEVFNCLCGAKWGFTSQLFGHVPQADRVITYAASAGSTCCAMLPAAVAQRISEAFRDVSAFSVRDENTRQFVCRLSKVCPEVHLDPVAIGDFTEEMALEKLPAVCSGRYCVVYSYHNRVCDPREINQIRAFCRKHQLRIVAVGAPQKWIRDYPVLNPFEVLKVFANADFVITDTFHGAVFSAKYAKRFAVLVRESNRNKLEDLVQRLSLQAHRITDISLLEDTYLQEKRVPQLDSFLAEQRKKAVDYLQKKVCGEKE